MCVKQSVSQWVESKPFRSEYFNEFTAIFIFLSIYKAFIQLRIDYFSNTLADRKTTQLLLLI